MKNRAALTAVFTLSFLTFLSPQLTVSVQLIPLVLFATLVVVRVLFSLSILRALGSLFEMDGLLFVVLLSSLLIGSSMASAFDRSLDYALMFVACLFLARLYMAVVPIGEVLEAFFWSGIVCMGLLVSLSFQTLIEATQTLDRFSFLNLQTNLLALLLAGYLCAMVWKFLEGKWRMRVLTGLIGIVCVIMIFFASARGVIIGILVGCLVAAGMALKTVEKDRQKQLVRRMVFAAVVLLGTFLFVRSLSWFKDAFDFVDRVLAISNSYRGLDSGFTGRFDSWSRTIRILSDGSWLTGRGFRSSDSLYPMIDDSYLVILYDLGLVPLILITWRFLSILRRVVVAYFRVKNESQRQLYLVSSVLMVVLLVVSISERYLFAMGNPYSLLALLFFATPTSALDLAFQASPNDLKAPVVWAWRQNLSSSQA